VEAEHVAAPQRIIGIARGEPLGRVRVGIDPDVAGAAGLAAVAAVGRDHVLGGADGEPCILQIEVFAANAEAAAKRAGAAGIPDPLAPQRGGRELALDDLPRRDPGVALVHRGGGGAVLDGARAAAAADDLVLHVALAGIGVAAAEDDRAAAAAVGARLAGHDM